MKLGWISGEKALRRIWTYVAEPSRYRLVEEPESWPYIFFNNLVYVYMRQKNEWKPHSEVCGCFVTNQPQNACCNIMFVYWFCVYWCTGPLHPHTHTHSQTLIFSLLYNLLKIQPMSEWCLNNVCECKGKSAATLPQHRIWRKIMANFTYLDCCPESLICANRKPANK